MAHLACGHPPDGRNSMSRKLIAAVVTLGLAGTGAGAGAAATAPKKADPPAKTFQENLAERLGVSPDKLLAATKEAGVDTVDDLQKSGKIDSARAARLKARIARSGRAPFAQLGVAQKRAPALRAGFRALAGEVGVKPKDLRAQLRRGTTPADAIEKAGKDSAAVKAAVRDAARNALDEQVQAGHLDAAEADQRAAKI